MSQIVTQTLPRDTGPYPLDLKNYPPHPSEHRSYHSHLLDLVSTKGYNKLKVTHDKEKQNKDTHLKRISTEK